MPGRKGGVTGNEVISVGSGDNDGGDTEEGAGTDGVRAGAGVMDTGGLQSARGSLSNDKDKDAMIVNDAETAAEANTKSNTIVTKSIAMLNATIMASVWSLTDRIPCTMVTVSVPAFL